MDTFTIIELEILTGGFCALAGLYVGSGLRKFAISRVQSFLFDSINAYIAGFIENLQKDPKMAEQLVKPFIAAAMAELQGGGGSGPREKNFKIGGIPIPSSLISKALEMILGRVAGPIPKGSKIIDPESLLKLPS